MKSINLLPKKSFWSVWFAPLTILLIIIYITSASAIYYNLHTVRQQQEQISREINHIEQAIEGLRLQRIPDPRTAALQEFQEAVTQLDNSRTDWLPAVHALISNLPFEAEIEQGKAEANSIALEIRFPTMLSVVDYIRVTRSSKLFQDIRIQSVTSQHHVMIGEDSKLGRNNFRASLTFVLADGAVKGGEDV